MEIYRTRRFWTIVLVLVLAFGCTTVPTSPATLSPSNLKPYFTEARTVSPSATIVATEIPIPSPTPSTYLVERGDTLSTIAEHFGIRLADLQAANPGVVAEALSVGQKLKIPAASSGAGGNTIPVPALAEITATDCYPVGSGEYCLVLVHNPFPDPLENVKLQLTLVGSSGQSVGSREAFLPLNLLPTGSSLPAYAFFPSPATGRSTAQLASAIRLSPGDLRYLTAISRNTLVSVDWGGRSARVQGQVFLLGDKPATTIWVAGIAYDVDGRVIGFRRWEWTGSLKPGAEAAFDFQVYSLGPVIERVETVIEARP